MDVYTYFTPGHETFFQNYLRHSVTENFRLIPLHGEERCAEEAEFNSAGWMETCVDKVRKLRMALEGREGDIVLYSDPDVIFLDVTPKRILEDLGGAEFAAQRGDRLTNRLCAGFFVMRVNERTLRFLNKVAVIAPRCHDVHDQEAMQRLRHLLDWKLLPESYWHIQLASGQFWDGDETKLVAPPANAAIAHATWISGRTRKQRFLDWIMQHRNAEQAGPCE